MFSSNTLKNNFRRVNKIEHLRKITFKEILHKHDPELEKKSETKGKLSKQKK